MNAIFRRILPALCAWAAVGSLFAQGTAFTYQGRLNANGASATGNYDLTFALFSSSNGVGQLGGTLTNLNTSVTNGLFSVTLNFGSGVFTGGPTWLQIGVRTNGGAAFTTLTPLQPVAPAPYAIFAGTAGSLNGTLPAAQLPPSVLTNNATGVTLTGAFTGNGGGLTNIALSGFAGLGGMAFQPTNGPVMQNATNYNNLTIGTNGANLSAVLQLLGHGINRIYFSDTANSYLQNIATHSDGEEVALLAPRIAIVPADGIGFPGAVQHGAATFGTVDGSHGMDYWNASKYPQTTNDPLGYSYFLEWTYTYYNGVTTSDALGLRAEARDTNGAGSLTIYYPTFGGKQGISGPNLNEFPGVPILEHHGGPNPYDIGIAYHGHFTRDATAVTATGTNYAINFDGTNEVTLLINLDLNLAAATNGFARTNQSDAVTLYVNPLFLTLNLSVPTNWFTNSTWSSSLTGSNIYELNVRRQIIGGSTNYYANLANTFPYSLPVDPDVAAYMNAAGITGISNTQALHLLVTGLKNAGIWTNCDCLYPFLGTNAAQQKWNLANLSQYNLTFTAGASTFTTSGWTTDGTASYADTGLNPSTAINPKYTLNSATLYVYSGSPMIVGSGNRYFMDASSLFPGSKAGLGINASNVIAAEGLNDINSLGVVSVGGQTTLSGSFAMTRTASNVEELFTGAGSIGDAWTSSSVPTVNFYLGARNNNGTVSSFIGARFELVMIGGGLTPTQVTTMSNLVYAFEVAEGRQ